MAEQVNPALTHKIVNVKENKAFRKQRKRKEIIDIIVNELKKNPNRSKNDVSCIIRCCDLIENLVKKKYKMDKFDILLNVFIILFGAIQGTELEVLKNAVEAVLDCKLIKKVPRYRELYSYAKNVFSHNFLFRDQQHSE
jgi:hypothetical protein